MGWEITRRKNGNYDVFDSVPSKKVCVDSSRESLIQFYVGRKAIQAEEEMRTWLNEVDTKADAEAARKKKAARKAIAKHLDSHERHSKRQKSST